MEMLLLDRKGQVSLFDLEHGVQQRKRTERLGNKVTTERNTDNKSLIKWNGGTSVLQYAKVAPRVLFKMALLRTAFSTAACLANASKTHC